MCKCKDKKLGQDPAVVAAKTSDPLLRRARVRYTYNHGRQLTGNASGLLYANGKIVQPGDVIDVQYRDYVTKQSIFELIGYVDELDAEKIVDEVLGVTEKLEPDTLPSAKPYVYKSRGKMPTVMYEEAGESPEIEPPVPPAFPDVVPPVAEVPAE